MIQTTRHATVRRNCKLCGYLRDTSTMDGKGICKECMKDEDPKEKEPKLRDGEIPKMLKPKAVF